MRPAAKPDDRRAEGKIQLGVGTGCPSGLKFEYTECQRKVAAWCWSSTPAINQGGRISYFENLMEGMG